MYLHIYMFFFLDVGGMEGVGGGRKHESTLYICMYIYMTGYWN